MSIQPYGYNFHSNSNPYYEDSSQKERKDQTPLFEINEQLHITPRHPSPSLTERHITIKKEKSEDFDSIIVEEEEFDQIKVKEEPEIEPTNPKILLSIKTIKDRITRINPNFDPELEIGVENCLPCVISFYNWILSGSAFPEAVDPYATPLHEHMSPLRRHTACLLQDPFLQKLHNPKIVNDLDKDANLKEYICLTEDLPLTFKSVPLMDLKKEIAKNVAWQQYEKGGENFKLGILFLNHRNDESQAHFLAFEYCKTKNSKTKSDYTLYITDPQCGEVYTFDQFKKSFRFSYSNNIKMWTGQNRINYNCNKRVEEIFASLKAEEVNKCQPSIEMEQTEKTGAGAANTKLRINIKRKRQTDEELARTSSKQKLDISNSPTLENAWGRIAKMANSTSLNTENLAKNASCDSDLFNDLPAQIPQSILNTIDESETNKKITSQILNPNNFPRKPQLNIEAQGDITVQSKLLAPDGFNHGFNNFDEEFHQLKLAAENGNIAAKQILESQDVRETDLLIPTSYSFIPSSNSLIPNSYSLFTGSNSQIASIAYSNYPIASSSSLIASSLDLKANSDLIVHNSNSEKIIQNENNYNQVEIYVNEDNFDSYDTINLKEQELLHEYKELKRKAKNGDANAQLDLGKLYLNEYPIPNLILARHYLELADKQGHVHAKRQLNKMSNALRLVDPVTYDKLKKKSRIDIESQDHKLRELSELKLKAKKGEADAQFKLGQKYFNDIPSNLILARYNFKLAANQGHIDAKKKLEEMSKIDFGTEMSKIDRLEKLPEYSQLIIITKKDEADAHFNLGQKYLNENPPNLISAQHYFNLASNLGHMQAQFNLGNMYFFGFGRAQDLIEALKYYKLAALQGCINSKNKIKEILRFKKGV